MEYNSEEAKIVAQELLDKTGDALRTGNFEAFISCFSLPQVIETFDGQRIFETPEELRASFEAVRAYHNKIGMTEMARHCVTAAFKDHQTIDSVHETRLVSGSVMAQAPYPVYSVLKFTGKQWQVARCSYAIPDAPQHNEALMGRTKRYAEEPAQSA